ncbi:MAG: lipopolysaccharide heptosyltransferase II [Burkholderiaceae bacterium]|nr:lipopolysaccharide heptosyltransferase II [Burkholderiaceae bacterium]
MSQPLVARLVRDEPDGIIDVAAPPHIAPVMRAMPGIADVIEAPNTHGRLDLRMRWRLARRIRARGYDRCIVLPNSLKSALVPWLAGIPLRVGHRGEARRLLLNRIHPDARDHDARSRPMVDFYAELAAPPGAPPTSDAPDPVLARSPQTERLARERFGIDADTPLFVLCPGAEYGPAKRWPTRHFGSLAARIAARWPDATIIVLGSAKERALATELITLGGVAVRNLAGETTVSEALALVSQADGVVSNDSGMMHVAAAYRRPQVAVFGSSDPRHTPPRSPRARIEWLGMNCSPCFARTCPLGHTDCLNGIAPAKVLAALQEALSTPPPAPHAKDG